MIDFKKAKKARPTKSSGGGYRLGIALYDSENKTWNAAVKNIGLVPIAEESCSIVGVKVLYSMPDNDNYPDAWTKKESSGNYTESKSDLNVIMQYWSRFKPGLEIKGNVINGKFVLI